MTELNRVGHKFAGTTASLLVVGLAGIAAFTRIDSGRHRNLETWSEPSAAGDKSYFDLPKGADFAKLGAIRSGTTFGPSDGERLKRRDSKMMAESKDDSGKLTFYRSTDPGDAGSLFLKVAPETYVRVQEK